MVNVNEHPIITTNGERRQEIEVKLKNNCKLDSFCDDNFSVGDPQIEVKNDQGNWESADPGQVCLISVLFSVAIESK